MLILERFPANLELRLQAGLGFQATLDLLIQAARHCQQLRDGPGVHGALRPGNILIDAEGGVHLSDVVTPTARRSLSRLLAASPDFEAYLPPEVTGTAGEPPFSSVCDTFALGMLVWRAVLGNEPGAGLPDAGPDKAAVVTIKDRLHARVKQDDSNPRFHARLAERFSATVSRAISAKASPTPPYRFERVEGLLPRLLELRSLVRPEVDTVGRVLLDRPASATHFTTDETVRFSISVGCSPGVEHHKEIACGIAVFDRDNGERLREVPSTFDVNRHPSGRFRFQFEITDLPPGNYRMRAAFAIRDSGHEPTTKEAEFEIRAAHGYIPPPEKPPPGPLSLEPHVREPRTVTEPMAKLLLDDAVARPVHQPPPPAPAPPPQGLPASRPAPPLVSAPEPKPAPRVVTAKPTPPAGAAAAITQQVTDESAPTRVSSNSTVSFSGDTVPASSGDTAVPIEEPAPTIEVSRVPRPRIEAPPPARPAVTTPRPAPTVTPPTPAPAVTKPTPAPAVAKPTHTAAQIAPSLAADPPKPAPAPTPQPPSGSWADLPIGGDPVDDLTELGDDFDEIDELRPKPAVLQIVEMIRGDAWAMFMAGAAIIAIVLLLILFLLK